MVSIYKTNVTEKDLTRLRLELDKIDQIRQWNTDLEDCDNILRIVSNQNISEKIRRTLHKMNIECIEIF